MENSKIYHYSLFHIFLRVQISKLTTILELAYAYRMACKLVIVARAEVEGGADDRLRPWRS